MLADVDNGREYAYKESRFKIDQASVFPKSPTIFGFNFLMTDVQRSAVVFALTGGIACGKSEVGRFFGGMGFKVCDSDHVAHDLMARGNPVYDRVVETFGKDILADDGAISRPILGRMVFEDPEKRRVLDQLVHPAVRERLEQWISDRRINHEDAVIQVPLLFESGMETLDWDAILCVSSERSQILQRLKSRGIDPAEAVRRIDAQMPLEEKEKRSDFVIRNIGTLQQLERATQAAVECLSGER